MSERGKDQRRWKRLGKRASRRKKKIASIVREEFIGLDVDLADVGFVAAVGIELKRWGGARGAGRHGLRREGKVQILARTRRRPLVRIEK